MSVGVCASVRARVRVSAHLCVSTFYTCIGREQAALDETLEKDEDAPRLVERSVTSW